MRLPIVILTILALLGCGGEKETKSIPLSKTPVSVRGWIADIDTGESPTFRTTETEAARRAEMFKQTSIWVENAPYASGGIAETGAFVILDVPPGNVTIGFTAPGAGEARLVLENIPGNADVLIPGIVLAQGSARIADPSAVRVRIASRTPRPSRLTARIAGHAVPVTEVEPNALIDRRDYPVPPAYRAPVTTVR